MPDSAAFMADGWLAGVGYIRLVSYLVNTEVESFSNTQALSALNLHELFQLQYGANWFPSEKSLSYIKIFHTKAKSFKNGSPDVPLVEQKSWLLLSFQ